MGSKRSYKVRIHPQGKHRIASEGLLFSDLLREAGIPLPSLCGGKGLCGRCRIRLWGTVPPPTPFETEKLTPAEIQEGYRFACKARVSGPATVHVPSGVDTGQSHMLVAGEDRPISISPWVKKVYPSPFGGNGRTAVTAGSRLLYEEPGDTRSEHYGLAVDVGTTTVVAALISLTTGEEVALAADLNAQAQYGEDLMTRLDLAARSPDDAVNLRRAVQETLNAVTAEACRKAEVDPSRVACAVLAGNTAMAHLFLGEPVDSLAVYPFRPHQLKRVDISPADAGLSIHPSGCVTLLPGIGGFVGADTIGVILATDLHQPGPPRAAVDIGTNGEIVMTDGRKLVAASAAAGPAFEGAHILHGMRAAPGAIDHWSLSADETFHVIGDGPARGICGSGLIDAAAELVRVGVVNFSGRLLPHGDLPASARAFQDRIVPEENAARFALTQGEEKIELTQADLRQIQLAKGAIAAAFSILLRELNLKPGDIDRLFVAGAFGNYADPARARAIGLFPHIPLSKIRSVGNAARIGARMALVSQETLDRSEKIADACRHIPLAERAEFQEVFAESMFFPPPHKNE